jgi:sulfate adenylyltransferase subunit 1 (EFTu-like GTPase family)
MALPSRRVSHIKSIVTFDGELAQAHAPQSVVLTLQDEVDISRGDLLVAPDAPAITTTRFTASLVWMDEQPLQLNRRYLLKHTSRTVHAQVAAVDYRLDIATLDHQPASTLTLNGIGVVEIETAQPLAVDLYSQSRITGSFVLIDPVSNSTAAAGMIREAVTGAKTSIAPDLDRAEAHRQLARVAEFFDLTAPDGAVAQHVRRALAALEESDE